MPIVGSFAGASARAYGAGAGGLIVGDFSSIQTITVGAGGANTIDFTSIPQTYTHLQIRYIAKNNVTTSNDGSDMTLSYNSDTTYTNYRSHQLYGTGAAASSIALQQASIYADSGIIPFSGSGQTNVFGAGIIDIFDYRNTNKYKTNRSVAGIDWNGAGYVMHQSSVWLNTSAITSITIYNFATTRNFVQYSTFALYGVQA